MKPLRSKWWALSSLSAIAENVDPSLLETVPRDAGVLVPADDADAFAAALRTLLEDDPRRLAMAKCSAAAGAARPAWTETALQIRCALESALAGDRDE